MGWTQFCTGQLRVSSTSSAFPPGYRWLLSSGMSLFEAQVFLSIVQGDWTDHFCLLIFVAWAISESKALQH